MALSDVYAVGIAYGILAFFSALFIKNVKMEQSPKAAGSKDTESEERLSTEAKKDSTSEV
jgi:hypothetical protein